MWERRYNTDRQIFSFSFFFPREIFYFLHLAYFSLGEGRGEVCVCVCVCVCVEGLY